MTFPKTRFRGVVLLAIAVLIFGGWLLLKPSPKDSTGGTSNNTNTNKPSTSQNQTTGGGQTPSQAHEETQDFSYQKPDEWAEMSKSVLDSSGAASGIARPTAPAATFTIKVSSATPKDSNDLKAATLAELKKFSNFKLVSSVETKVDGESGQKFNYNFSDQAGQNDVTQEMNVVVHKQKTYFLLFSSAAGDFGKEKPEFTQILSSFKFK